MTISGPDFFIYVIDLGSPLHSIAKNPKIQTRQVAPVLKVAYSPISRIWLGRSSFRLECDNRLLINFAALFTFIFSGVDCNCVFFLDVLLLESAVQ